MTFLVILNIILVMNGAVNTAVCPRPILRIVIAALLTAHAYTCTKRPPKQQPPPLTGRHGIARVLVAHGNLSKDVGMISGIVFGR